MELRNIHFTCEDESTTGTAEFIPPEESSSPSTLNSQPSTASTKLRLRKVKVSPHQEYALRAGEVRPISDSLAALICSRKGRAEIGPKGITVERKDIGGKRIYHHVDSVLCNDLSQRERKIYYVLNSLKPEVIHLLDDTGRYLESLPEKAQPGVLDNAAQAIEYADQKRQVNRLARHLQELHGEDTKEAIAALTHNAGIMKGIVQVLGTDTPSPTNAPAPSALGDRIQAGERKINDIRTNRISASAFGRAVALNRREIPAAEPQGEVEDWSANSRSSFSQPSTLQSQPLEDWSQSPARSTPQTTPTENIESW
jgi:hypothetical protein